MRSSELWIVSCQTREIKLNNNFCLCTKAQMSFRSMSAVSNAKVTANLHLPHPDEELLKPSGANLQCPPVQKMGGCFESQAVLKLSANLKLCHTGQAASFYQVMVFSLASSFPIYWLYPCCAHCTPRGRRPSAPRHLPVKEFQTKRRP